MTQAFFKYHGTGNDFIMIDNRGGSFPGDPKMISGLCHRRFGIGADGLILLNASDRAAFNMRYFNADGHEGSMCGNGGRCVAAFARQMGITDNPLLFEATDGIHQAAISDQSGDLTQVSLSMMEVSKVETDGPAFILNTGSPHHVVFVENVHNLDVVAEGKAVRYSGKYKEKGINVDFAEARGDELFVRTYERGVEDETLSCGTGVVAAAIAYAVRNSKIQKVKISTPGGTLQVSFASENGVYSDILLTGPATCVYNGFITI